MEVLPSTSLVLSNTEERVKNNYELLTWEYGKHYLRKIDKYQLHYCTFALGDNFEHSHQENYCITCLTCF